MMRCLDEPHLPVPAFSALRAVHEAVLPVFWVCDGSASPHVRLVRAAALRLHTAQENWATLRLFPTSEGEQSTALAALTELQSYLKRAGFERKPHGEVPELSSRLSLDGHSEPLTLNATDVTRTHVPGLLGHYVSGSGAAHSRLWFTGNLVGTVASTAIALVMPLLDISTALADAVCTYSGIESHPYLVKTHQRRIALARRARLIPEDDDPPDYRTFMELNGLLPVRP